VYYIKYIYIYKDNNNNNKAVDSWDKWRLKAILEKLLLTVIVYNYMDSELINCV